MKKWKKELPLIAITLFPVIYLAFVWSNLPEKVPMHYDFQGNIDRYGSKTELIWISLLLPAFVYVLFLLLPLIDPKKKLQNMGNKLLQIRYIMTIFMSALSVFIIYSSKNPSVVESSLLFAGIGLLFIILGNYFKTIKPNYFLGIRTPWTLENEIVWKDTHRLAGKIWFFGGSLIIIFCLIIPNQETLSYIFMGIAGLLALIPIIYSYLRFRKLKN